MRLLKPVAGFLVSLLVASWIVFALVNLLPGDIAGVILGPNASADAVAALRQRMGLDEPLMVRYLAWMGTLVSGHVPTSALSGAQVGATMAGRFAVSGWLVVFGMIVAIAIAAPLGAWSALHRHRVSGAVVSGLAQFGMTVPVFMVGICMTIVFGVRLRWLPANGYVPLSQSPAGWLSHLVLPTLTLGAVQSAILVRYVRSAFIDVLRTDWFRTARSVGWRRWAAVWRHGLRNTGLQLLTVVGLQVGTLFAGAIVVESVFAIPGIGSYLLQNVSNRDLPVVATIVLLLVALVLFVNLLVDLSYGIIDPRQRTSPRITR